MDENDEMDPMDSKIMGIGKEDFQIETQLMELSFPIEIMFLGIGPVMKIVN